MESRALNWYLQSTWIQNHKESAWYDEWVICDLKDRGRRMTEGSLKKEYSYMQQGTKATLALIKNSLVPATPEVNALNPIAEPFFANRLVYTAPNT